MKSWEEICSRCGLCCHEKVVQKEFLLIDIGKPCQFYPKFPIKL